MKLTDATSYTQAFGILLETIDTGTDAAATDEFAATVARAGSFKVTELVMAPGADITQRVDAPAQKPDLSGRGCKLRTCLENSILKTFFGLL
jgi:hypothetical protein